MVKVVCLCMARDEVKVSSSDVKAEGERHAVERRDRRGKRSAPGELSHILIIITQ
jgi:hypothetical protein